MMPSLAHVLLKRRSALSKDSFSLTFTSDMNFPPSRCEIRVRERLTFFTVHLGIIHKKTALVNKNKRIGARKFDFSANFGFPDQKADTLSLLLFISRQTKKRKNHRLSPASCLLERKTDAAPPENKYSRNPLDSGCTIFLFQKIRSKHIFTLFSFLFS